MKTILFLTILTQLALPQNGKMLLLFDGGYKNAETTLYLTGQTVTPAQATRIDNFITMLKDSLGITSLSSKFDAMYLLANESATLGLRNLVKRSSDATAVNSPTFTQWEGFTGNGTSSYLNSNYNPTSAAGVFTLNSASMGIYSRTDGAGNWQDLAGRTDGAGVGFSGMTITDGSSLYIRMNSNNAGMSVTNTVGLGFFIATRINSDSVSIYRNGIKLSEQTKTTNGLTNANIFIGALNTAGVASSYSTRQYSFVYFGSDLTQTQYRMLNNCVEWYMDALGKGVIP